MDFSLITYREMHDLDPDDRLLLEELDKRGFSCQPLVWDEPGADWTSAGVCVMRSAWDYHLKHNEFLSWIDTISGITKLVNAPALMRWNLDKRYLLELSQKGVPVVPTHLASKGDNGILKAIAKDNGYTKLVVKPSIGLATFGVKSFEITEDGLFAAEEHLKSLLLRGDALIQPYLESVVDYGERALVFVAGEYSHAVRKTPFQPLMQAGLAGEVAVEAEPEEIAVASQALSTLKEKPLYARVDLVRSGNGANGGQPVIIELELVEPSLFLATHPQAVVRLADALEVLAD